MRVVDGTGEELIIEGCLGDRSDGGELLDFLSL